MNIDLYQNRVLPEQKALINFAYRLLGNSDEAKDVVQDVLVKVWNGRERLSEIENIEGWCKRLTRNLSIDKIRARQCRKTESMSLCLHLKMENLNPLESAEQQESLDKIKRWIEVLPKKQREVMHLRDLEGYTYNEICDLLNLDLTMVKVRLFRARKTVKEKFIKVHSYGL